MARQSLTPATMPGSYGTWTVFTFAAADASNKEQFTLSPGDILIIFNSGATPRNVTLTSVADRLGRTKDVGPTAVAAGAYAVFGPIQLEGWQQTDGKFYLEAAHAEVKYAILRAA